MAPITLPTGPGKTAPRLIQDLLDYDPRYIVENKRNLLADNEQQYQGQSIWRRGNKDCRHSLMKKANLTIAPLFDTETPDESTHYAIASYCMKCRYHLEISVDFRSWEKGDMPCSLSQERNPLHHLRRAKSNDDIESLSKYDTLAESHQFYCTNNRCPLELEIKIYPPRLRNNLLSCILDPVKLKVRETRIRASENPERYAAESPLTSFKALGHIRQYLLDAKGVKSVQENKRISRRNKKFLLAFDRDCDDLFNYLDFTLIEEVDPEDDETREEFFQLPLITNHNINFINDALIEIDLLIAERAPQHRILFEPALNDIERALGCFKYPTRSRTVDVDLPEHPYYQSLGAVDRFTDELLSWAFDRQSVCDPTNRPYYLDCLSDLANGRNSSDLQTKVVLALSDGESGLKRIQNAYKFFGLTPHTYEGDDHLIGLYRSRIEAAPRQKEDALENVRIIGKARNSSKLENVANNPTISYEDALALLDVHEGTASDMIVSQAVVVAIDLDKARVANALRVIAGHRSDDPHLLLAASDMDYDNEESMDVNEAYSQLQIPLPGKSKEDNTVLYYYAQKMSDAKSDAEKAKYQRALRVIAYVRNSDFLKLKSENPNAIHEAPSGEPVGIQNVGNTCYLASLMQLFYTIPLRDNVLAFQDNFPDRVKDGSDGVRFVGELATLFHELKTTRSPSVQPTRTLATWPLSHRNPRDQAPTASVLGPEQPPPLPLRPSPALEEDVVMIDPPDDKTVEIDDNSSEDTMVDVEAVPFQDKESLEPPSTTSPQVMEGVPEAQSMEQDEAANKSSTRNKAGLSIQTDKKESNDTWKSSDQEDVGDAFLQATELIKEAFPPTVKDGSGPDHINLIEQLFEGQSLQYTQKGENLEPPVSDIFKEIRAFPSTAGPRNIYEALDVGLDAEDFMIGETPARRYSSLTKLPPVLMINIQRTAYENSGRNTKNSQVVDFPLTIFLDRYMESDAVLVRRREAWKWKIELQEKMEKLKVLEGPEDNGKMLSVNEALAETNLWLEKSRDILDDTSAVRAEVAQSYSEGAEEAKILKSDIFELKEKLRAQFADLNDFQYSLHAVIIHIGQQGGSGHYWIYIYDSENNIWRKHNDETVSVVKDVEKIFHPGDFDGTPYYLVYVPTKKREQIAQAVCREVGDNDVAGNTEQRNETVSDEVNNITKHNKQTESNSGGDLPPLEQVLQIAGIHKKNGQRLAVNRIPKEALKEYVRGIETLDDLPSSDDETWNLEGLDTQELYHSLQISLYSNAALVANELELWDIGHKYTTLLLRHSHLTPENKGKALHSLAVAQKGLNDRISALTSLERAHRLVPDDLDVEHDLTKLRNAVREETDTGNKDPVLPRPPKVTFRCPSPRNVRSSRERSCESIETDTTESDDDQTPTYTLKKFKRTYRY